MNRFTIPAVSFLLLACACAYADSAAEAIARASFELPEASTMQSTAYMLLVDKNGSQNLRALSMYSRKTKDGTDSYAEFLSPADVRGTKFLTLAEAGGESTQRLWLPELMKVRRIASADKGSKFLGSDLTYYDMDRHNFGDFTYTKIGEATTEVVEAGVKKSVACWIIECSATYSSVPYSRMRMWIGKEDSFVYRSTMWNAKGAEEKTIYILEVEKRQGIMLSVKTAVVSVDGHKTLLQMSKIELNKPIDPRIFTVQNLEQ